MSRRVVVVGAGILGTMHALFALERGCEVVHLDREMGARGASVRNFGLVWVSGRASGTELAFALRARRLWEELARRVPGLPFRPVGSLTVALDSFELEVMSAACALADAAQRQWHLLGPKEAVAVCPELDSDIEGALYCRADAIVEPRVTAPLLREYLAQDPAYQWFPGRQVVSLDQGAVLDDRGTWHRGDHVYLCTGAALSGLVASYVLPLPLRRVRLQMLETAPYAGRVTTALADGASMRYYPAYDLPARGLLAAQPPVAAANGAQLLLVQRADGSLTIGDTHDYDEPLPFDVEEDIYDYLLGRAGALLRGPVPPVRRRWAGVYCELMPPAREVYWRHELAANVEVVTGPGGRGMTCSPAIAEESMARLGPAGDARYDNMPLGVEAAPQGGGLAGASPVPRPL